ncbi:methyltransferase domain-containing protein [Tianweitania sediminis]|uniref:Methyltransferase domain-containing protein n=1 Tax=Tianweitania sediminis TaxID=1502156 RepID=A0A8J7UH42_9HYPH|nr:methyltransferase domain-containing protein [Tianweitania sediminis]MBP0437373.1 methyltransferase domain-containing protein [Tianweitania sediminis]
MVIASLSSGDLLADRRADYAEMLAEGGDLVAAAELMAAAMELAPAWAAGWFRLGELREKGGDMRGAAQAWREALRLEPADRLGATLKLALIGEASVPETPPAEFVEALFDDYADRFDASLLGKLDYRVPQLIEAAIQGSGRSRFSHGVDLGCGTGLMGEKLRPICERLDGIDLSAEMLRKAEARGVYDRLIKGDISEWEAGRWVDLVTAADVFMYVGTLDTVFRQVAGMLARNGLFVFSVEVSDGDELVLRESRRYAHSQAYVERELAAAGLQLWAITRETIRQDRGEAIKGLVVVAAPS